MCLIINFMGCDYSILVKQEFTEKSVAIAKTVNRIKKKKERTEALIRSFKGIDSDNVNCLMIRENLVQQLENVENLLAEIKKVKERSPSISLSISSSFEEAPRPPLASEANEKAKPMIHPKTKAKVSSSKGFNLYTTESILEDPEIMALISKNRNRLLKRLTK